MVHLVNTCNTLNGIQKCPNLINGAVLNSTSVYYNVLWLFVSMLWPLSLDLHDLAVALYKTRLCPLPYKLIILSILINKATWHLQNTSTLYKVQIFINIRSCALIIQTTMENHVYLMYLSSIHVVWSFHVYTDLHVHVHGRVWRTKSST